MTCRYCKQCDTLICHKDFFEHFLTTFFEQYDPVVIGNEYIIVGTVEKKNLAGRINHPQTCIRDGGTTSRLQAL